MNRNILIIAIGLIFTTTATAPPVEPERKASQFVPIVNEPPAELFVDKPIAGPLSRGVAVIPYRTNHFRILPILGPAAVNVSPRAGHLHVSVDDLPWRWADAGDNGSVVVNGLPAGPHKVLIELATPEHKILTSKSVSFIIPVTSNKAANGSHGH